MRRFAVSVVLVLALAPVAAAAVPAGGVRGVVKQMPPGMCPAGDPCDGVARNVSLSSSRAGQRVHRVRTDENGRFTIRLRPGRYRVGAANAMRITPRYVTVPKTGFARVVIELGDLGVDP